MLSNTCPHCGKDMGASSTCPHCEHKREAADAQPGKRFSACLVLLMIILCFFAGFAYYNHTNYMRGRAFSWFTTCQSNQKNLGTALELYAADHKGHYPKKLSELTPAYIKEIPTCPEAESDTYSATYKSSKVFDAYTYYCKGDNHIQCTDYDYPLYNSYQGLVTRP